MRRAGRRLYLPLIGLGAFLVFLVAGFPLALALDISGLKKQGLSWTGAQGTLWAGSIANLSVDAFPIGTVQQRTNPVPLVTGRLATQLEVLGRSVNGEGDVTLTGETVTVRDAAYVVDLAPLDLLDAFGAPMRGMVRAETDYFSAGSNGCAGGTVDVWTDAFTYSAASYGGEGFALSGTASCGQEGVTLFSLSGAENGRAVTINAEIRPSLDYLVEVTVTGLPQSEADALLLYGFQRQDDDTLTLIQQDNALLRD